MIILDDQDGRFGVFRCGHRAPFIIVRTVIITKSSVNTTDGISSVYSPIKSGNVIGTRYFVEIFIDLIRKQSIYLRYSTS